MGFARINTDKNFFGKTGGCMNKLIDDIPEPFRKHHYKHASKYGNNDILILFILFVLL